MITVQTDENTVRITIGQDSFTVCDSDKKTAKRKAAIKALLLTEFKFSEVRVLQLNPSPVLQESKVKEHSREGGTIIIHPWVVCGNKLLRLKKSLNPDFLL